MRAVSAEPASVVYIVDDQDLVRRSLSRLVESVGMSARAYASPAEFLEAYDRDVPGCLILDVRLPGMSGIELQEKLAAEGSAHPVILISGHADVPTAVRAMKAGAVDFVEKPVNDQELLDRIQRWVATDLERRKDSAEMGEVLARFHTLTAREREVLRHVVDGMSTKEVARTLGLSPKTVDIHRGNIMQKLAVHSAVELTRLASLLEAEKGISPNSPASGRWESRH